MTRGLNPGRVPLEEERHGFARWRHQLRGLSSGIPTEEIISKLVELSRRPIGLLERQRDESGEKLKLFQELNSKTLALRDALRPLDNMADVIRRRGDDPVRSGIEEFRRHPANRRRRLRRSARRRVHTAHHAGQLPHRQPEGRHRAGRVPPRELRGPPRPAVRGAGADAVRTAAAGELPHELPARPVKLTTRVFR